MFHVLDELSHYDITWNTPSKNDRGFMPLGNGDTTLNFWTTKRGIELYFTKSDNLNENDVNCTTGKVKISFSPNPFETGVNFKQTLHVSDGFISLQVGEAEQQLRAKLFVSEADNLIYIDFDCDKETTFEVEYFTWREDDVVKANDAMLYFYHKNQEVCIDWQLNVLELSQYRDACPDYLTNRIFGGAISITNGKLTDDNKITTTAKKALCKILAESVQNKSEEEFITRLKNRNEDTLPVDKAFEETKRFWNEYWNKSYIFIEGDKRITPELNPIMDKTYYETYDDNETCVSSVTQAYILTKFMFECNARGKHPIRYNGLNHLTCPAGGKPFIWNEFAKSLSYNPLDDPTKDSNPDERPWGNHTMWQNVRCPYYSMLHRGEYSELKVLFDYYMQFIAINKFIAHEYYDATGIHTAEETMTYGTMEIHCYGIDRTGLKKGYAINRWGGALEISPGLELSNLMLDYCEYTNDETYLKETVLPYAKGVLEYVATRFKNRDHGKIDISPFNVLETYWDTKNPLPVVVGMHTIIDRVLDLNLPFEREFFQEMKRITPDISFEEYEGTKILKIADEYKEERHNVEPGELYAIYPFRYFTKDHEPKLANDTYEASKRFGTFRPYTIGDQPGAPTYSGWQYTGMAAALLGKREDLRDIMEHNATLTNPAYRFPAMWGPIYDSVPDVDHGATILNTLQLSLLQFDGDTIVLLPAFPQNWNAKFKLYAPKNTQIECEYINGKIVSLQVTPKEREKDIIIQNNL